MGKNCETINVLGGIKEILPMTESVLNDPPIGFSMYYGNVMSGVDYGNVFSVVTQDGNKNKRGLQLFMTYNGVQCYLRCIMGSNLTSWKGI